MGQKSKKLRLMESGLRESDLMLHNEMSGIDQWISLYVEGKRQEILKQQMLSHLRQMRVLRFDFNA